MKTELKSGIKEFDEAVEQFENGEITFVELTSNLWNTAYKIGQGEKSSQFKPEGKTLSEEPQLSSLPNSGKVKEIIDRYFGAAFNGYKKDAIREICSLTPNSKGGQAVKKEAIDFAEWIDFNDHLLSDKTIPELYDLFKQSNK